MVAYSRGQLSNDIERFFVPVVAILFWVTSLAGVHRLRTCACENQDTDTRLLLLALAASYITKKAAMRALGNAMVNDPDYRVPAWTLAKTVDEGGIQLA